MKHKLINPENREATLHQNFTDVQTQKRIEEHMSDINDKITEEDLQNIRTDMYDGLLKNKEGEEKDSEITEIKDQETIEKEKEKEESQKINSIWNILED